MTLLALASAFSLAFVSGADAAINKKVNYQAKLTDASNMAVSDGGYNLRFKLYTAPSGGSPIWTETLCYSPDSGATCDGSGSDSRITVTNGLLSVMLGSVTSLASVDFNQTLYLGVEVGGSGATPSWDGEMTPRKVLGVVPAAMVAETLQGLDPLEFLRSDAANSTSTASTFLTVEQSGAGDIARFLGQSGANALTIASSGNVGISSTTPSGKLSIDLASNFDTGIAINGSGFAQPISVVNEFGGNVFSVSYSGSTSIGGNFYTPGVGTFGAAGGSATIGDPNFAAGYFTDGTRSVKVADGVNALISTGLSSFIGDLSLTGKFLDSNGSEGSNGYLLKSTGSATEWLDPASLGFALSSQIGSGLAGQVPFYDADGANLTATSSIFIGSNQFVGVGTTSPWAKLAVNPVAGDGNSFVIGSSTATSFVVNNAGNVGIGTANPTTKFEVYNSTGDGRGSILNTTSVSNAFTGFTNNPSFGIGQFVFGNGIDLAFGTWANTSGSGWSEKMRITAGGNVGVGTSSPWAQLSVNPNGITGPAFAVGSSTATSFLVTNGGRVGIGTTTPSSMLSVAGSASTPFVASFEDTNGLGKTIKIVGAGITGSGGDYANNGVSLGLYYNNPDNSNTQLYISRSANPTSGFRLMPFAGGGSIDYVVNGVQAGINVAQLSTSDYFTLTNDNGGAQRTALKFTATSPFNQDGGNYDKKVTLSSTWNLNSVDMMTFWATSTGSFIGIGTTSPWAQLSVNPDGITGPAFAIGSSTATNFIVTNGGNVGIGVTEPGQKLSVNGGIEATSIAGKNAGVTFFDMTADAYLYGQWSLNLRTWAGGPGQGGTGVITFQPLEVEAMRITSGGNVGVGTTSPFANLSIAGRAGQATPIFALSTSTAGYATNTAMIVDANGNVGIGSTSPYVKLGVNGDIAVTNMFIAGDMTYDTWTDHTYQASYAPFPNLYAQGMKFLNASSRELRLFEVSADGNGYISFFTGLNTAAQTEKMRLNNAGYLGIGTTSPWAKLAINPVAGDGNSFVIGSSTATKFVVTNGGNVGIGTTTPAATLGIAGGAFLSGTSGITMGYNSAQNRPVNVYADASDNLILSSDTGSGKSVVVNGWYFGGAGISKTDIFSNGYQLLLTKNPGVDATQDSGVIKLTGTNERTSGTYKALAIEQTYNQTSGTAANTDLFINRTQTAVGSGAQYLIDAQVGGVSKFNVTNTGNVGIGASNPGGILDIVGTGGTRYLFSTGDANLSLAPRAGGGDPTIASTGGNLNLQAAASLSLIAGGATRMTVGSDGNVGIGTSSPYARLSVVGPIVAEYFHATSTIATSTFAGGLSVGGGALAHDWYTGMTSVDNLQIGGQMFESDSGMVSWIDMPVTSASANGTVMSYTAGLNGNSMLTIFGKSDGAGGVNNLAVGIGSTTPWAALSVNASSTGPFFAVGSSTATHLIVANSGNVGVGTTSPWAKLSVAGGIVATATSTMADIIPVGPYTNNTGLANLGDTTRRWNSVWAKEVNIGTSTWKMSQASDGHLSIVDIGTGIEYFKVTSTTTTNIGTTTASKGFASASGLISNGSETIFSVRGSNTTAGMYAGKSQTTGSGNSFLGYYAGYNSTGGSSNVAVGQYAGYSLGNSNYNTMLGYYAGYFTSGGSNNFIAGNQAGMYAYNQNNAIFIGPNAGIYAGYGTDNIHMGYYSGANNYYGGYNITQGTYSGYMNYNGNYNIMQGFYAGYTNYSGTENVFSGKDAGYYNYNGNYNTYVGSGAGYANYGYNTNASTYDVYNTFVGYHAGYTNGSGFTNTLLGAYTDTTGDIYNATAIGYQAQATQSGTVILGGTSSYAVNVGIGLTTPSLTLEVATTSYNNVARFTNAYGYCDISPTNSSLSCSSDRRLKKDIESLSASSTLAALMKLRPVSYRWNAETGSTTAHVGLIAQEVEDILPGLVTTDAKGMKSIAYGSFTPLLISAFQEQEKRLQALELKLGVTASSTDIALASLFSNGPANGTTTLDAMLPGLTLTVPNVIAKGLTVDWIVPAHEEILLKGDAVFFGRPYFTADTAGFATVRKGDQRVDVAFERAYLEKPIVNASLSLADADVASATSSEQEIFSSDVRFLVSGATTTGFAIVLNKPAPRDLSFSWTAFAVKGAKTFTSIGPSSIQQTTDSSTVPTILPSALPSPTSSSTPIVTATPSPTDTPSPSPTPTVTPVPTETATPAPTDTPVSTPAPTESSAPSGTAIGPVIIEPVPAEASAPAAEPAPAPAE